MRNTNLDFEQETTKIYLAKFDFEFFLKQNIVSEKYSQANIDAMYQSYKQCIININQKSKESRKQMNLYSEGQVRKMFSGGLLLALFELDESRGYTIEYFSEMGINWGYFRHWQKYQRRKISRGKIWNFIIKSGSAVAILLAIIKLLETILEYS